MQTSAFMPSSRGQSQFSIRSLVALKSPIDFENILEGTYLPISTYHFCQNKLCSSVVHKLYNQFEALTVRAND